jgi:hypothetical protein
MKGNLIYRLVPVTIVTLSILAGLGIAGLLSYYGKVVGTSGVSQSVRLVIGDNEYQCTTPEACTVNEEYSDIVAGSTITKIYTLKNYASTDAPISISVEVSPENQGVTADVFASDCSNNTAPTSVPAASEDVPGTVGFCVKVDSALATVPATYTIITTVAPA